MVAPAAFAAVFDRLGGLPLPIAARELARAGVPVFPCVPGEKIPIVPSGFRRATTDPRRVAGWWRWQPDANIGIPTGAVSGLVVIDVDVHSVDGYASYARAARGGLIPVPLATVTTPTGGQHAYFPAIPGRVQRSWAVGKAGVDCRGDGGYVIAPPSTLRLDGASVVPGRAGRRRCGRAGGCGAVTWLPRSATAAPPVAGRRAGVGPGRRGPAGGVAVPAGQRRSELQAVLGRMPSG